MSALRIATRSMLRFPRPTLVLGQSLMRPMFLRFQSTLHDVPPATVYTYPEIKKLTLNPDPNKVLVDVREPEELQMYGSIPTSINVPFKSTPGALDLPDEDFEDLFGFAKPSKDKELIFYCQAGLRSAAAEELVGTFGYTHRGNYKGSFNDWYENESKHKEVKKDSN